MSTTAQSHQTNMPHATIQDMKQQASETASKLQDRGENVLNSALSTVQRGAQQASETSKSIIDSIITPETRQRLQSQAQEYASNHPKTATFIALNLLLTGIPIGLFTFFTVATFLFTTVSGLILGTLGAIIFTLLATGTALAVLLPTVLVTTGIATFLFFWGLVVFYGLRWIAGSGSSSHSSDSSWQTRGSSGSSATQMGERLKGDLQSATGTGGASRRT